MTSKELRQKFLKYFEERGHKILPSFSLVPAEIDPSVLFTTAGMHPFKRYYAEPDQAPSAAIATCQKCIRTGDIEEVGDATHLTFFEMLGNFSFGYPSNKGSYFKKESISFAWEFLTKELGIDIDRISATYFKGEDDISPDTESFELIKSITGLNDDKIIGTGKDETFWSLGTENSPGGPTVEFYIDDIEIWNLVFNEYVLKNGKYVPSEFKGVDTGMGLERLLAVLNRQDDVYKTDLFLPIIEKLEEISGKKYQENKKEFRIIADHIKTSILILSEGMVPSNKGAGYVLRRLIRRVIVKAKTLGIDQQICTKFIDPVCHSGLDPESIMILKQVQGDIYKELEKEESKFRKTLDLGMSEFQKWYKWESQPDKRIIPGSVVFNLFSTFGFPVELVREIAREKSLEIDEDGYANEIKKHQELSRTASAGMFKGGLADSSEETTKLHTAAHLLLAALRQVLGDGVVQKGSNITAERLRFDFSYAEKMTPEQISEVENIVNDAIAKNLSITMDELSIDEAKNSGAHGTFDDRYEDRVKVYTVGFSGVSGSPFSREICGGPHVSNTGELGHFKIKKEESSSAGVRRIKAILE